MKKIIWLLTAIAVMLGGQALVAPAASASEPAVELSNIQYGTASFSANGSAAATASLKTRTGVKIYLNVRVNPMPKKQIRPGTCRRAPVGKWFFNEMVDPATGKHYYKKMRVQAGDNVFCKDRKGVWRKKSCGNKAKGLFGVPRPPKSLIRFSGVIQDYLEWSGELSVKSTQSGSALAHVVQYHDGQKVCEAKATVAGSALAYVRMWVKVRSRTKIGISVTAANQAKVRASSSTTVQGMLKAKVQTSITGNATAMCNFTPPPPAYETPSVDVSPVACVEPGETRDVTVTVSNPNGIADTAKVTYRGQVFTKSVAAHGQVTFTFANQAAGTYSGTALLVNANKSKSFTVTVEECPPPADNPPVVNIMGSPAHLYVGGNAYIWIEASDPDGDAVTVKVSASGAGTVAGLVPSDVRWDGTACPSGKSCYRATAWAGSSPGTLTITATVTANGESDTDSVSFPVKADEF